MFQALGISINIYWDLQQNIKKMHNVTCSHKAPNLPNANLPSARVTTAVPTFKGEHIERSEWNVQLMFFLIYLKKQTLQ